MIINPRYCIGFVLGYLATYGYLYYINYQNKNIFITKEKYEVEKKINKEIEEKTDSNEKSKSEVELFFTSSEEIDLDEEIYNQLTSEEDEIYELKKIVTEIINNIVKKVE